MSVLTRTINYYEKLLENKEDDQIYLSLEHVNNWKLCLTCLTETAEADIDVDDMCVMDVQEERFLSVQGTIAYLVTDREDDLPLKICKECLDKIKTFYYFTVQIQRADKVLKLLSSRINLDKINSSTVTVKKEENLSQEFITINYEPPTQAIEVTSDVEVKQEITDTAEYSKNYNDPKNICPSNEILFVKEENELIINDIHSTEQYDSDEILQVADLENIAADTLLEIATNPLKVNTTISESLENSVIGKVIRKRKSNKCKAREKLISVDKNITKKLKNQKSKTKTLKTCKDVLKGDSSTNESQEKLKAEDSRKLNKSKKSKSNNKCMVCLKIFTYKAHLVKHAKELHPKVKAFKCPDCDILFSSMVALDRHHDGKHKNKILKKHICTYCAQACYSKVDLEIHIRRHTGERPYSCPNCDKTFVMKSNLVSHQMIHKEIDSNNSHNCPYCSKPFSVLSRLKKHLSVHTGELPYKCSLCDKSFRKNESLKNHTKNHETIKHKCTICNKTFGFKVDLRRHYKQFHGEVKFFKCENCDERFSSDRTLRRHIDKFHKRVTTKIYICDFCKKHFYSSGDLRSHLRQHTDERPYSCKLCKESSRHKLVMKRHIKRSHLKGYECELCSKSFQQVTLFKRHLRLHNGEPIYTCSLWEKAFKCRQDFNIETFIKGPHNNVNSGNTNTNKSLVCEFCSKKLSRYSNLRRHLKLHTGERPYSCHLCEKSYIDKCTLNCHLKTHMKREGKYSCNKDVNISEEDKNQEDYRNLTPSTIDTNHVALNIPQTNDNENDESAVRIPMDSGPTKEHEYYCESKDPLKSTNNINKSNTKNGDNLHFIEGKRHQNVTSKKLRFNLLMDYKCAVCHKVFNFQRDFIRHAEKIHRNTKTFQCRSCKKVLSSHHLLKSHFNRMHKDLYKRMNCEYCSKKFYTGAELRCHLKVHTGESLNKKTWKGKGNLNINQQITLPQIPQNVSVKDNITEKSTEKYEQSMKTIEDLKSTKEQSCSNKSKEELMKNSHNISKDVKSNRKSLEPLKPSSIIKISETEFVYDETVRKSAERLDKIAPKTYSCEFCFESFKHKSSMERHRKNYHLLQINKPKSNAGVNDLKTISTPSVTEENCTYLYDLDATTSGTNNIERSADYSEQTNEINSKSSMDKNEIEKRKCNLAPEPLVSVNLDDTQADTEDCIITNIDGTNNDCNSISNESSSSSQQIPTTSTSTTTTKFSCDQCQEIFKSKRRLNIHKETVHPESTVELNKINKCTFCPKIFRRYGDLKTHLRRHTGEDPFVCKVCKLSFKQDLDFRNHMCSHKSNDNSNEPTVEEKERVRNKFLEFLKSMK